MMMMMMMLWLCWQVKIVLLHTFWTLDKCSVPEKNGESSLDLATGIRATFETMRSWKRDQVCVRTWTSPVAFYVQGLIHKWSEDFHVDSCHSLNILHCFFKFFKPFRKTTPTKKKRNRWFRLFPPPWQPTLPLQKKKAVRNFFPSDAWWCDIVAWPALDHWNNLRCCSSPAPTSSHESRVTSNAWRRQGDTTVTPVGHHPKRGFFGQVTISKVQKQRVIQPMKTKKASSWRNGAFNQPPPRITYIRTPPPRNKGLIIIRAY